LKTYSNDNIKRWKKEFNNGKLTNKSVAIKSPEEQELIRLRKELADIKLERDILKKVVGIFSKSDK
jgi:transposase